MNSLSPESENSGSQLSLFAPDQVVEQKVALPTPRRASPRTATPAVPRRARRRAADPAWPSHEHFPYNNPHTGQTVGSCVLEELRASRSPLIITGYTSLSFVIDLLAHYRSRSDVPHVRLLLGHEPLVQGRSTYRIPGRQTFSRELEDYWLAQGVSVYQSLAVLAAITFLQTDFIEVRISGNPDRPVHAKIYQADHAITLGSSNFLNTTSNRSRALLRCAPEHTLLLTATPLNRELSDLLTIINLLGPDNFDDHIIELLLQAAQLRPSGGGKPKDNTALSMNAEDILLLQRAIQQFMLRRTKRQFNALIDQEPEAYRNRLGNLCRYPKTRAQYYPTNETDQDQRLILAVRNALAKLNGMAFVHKVLRVPDSPRWRNHAEPDLVWLNGMLQSAKALAGYHVLAALRSSRLAALEHLFGTRAAWSEYYEEPVPLKHAAETGNLRNRVRQLGGTLPVNQLTITDLPALAQHLLENGPNPASLPIVVPSEIEHHRLRNIYNELKNSI